MVIHLYVCVQIACPMNKITVESHFTIKPIIFNHRLVRATDYQSSKYNQFPSLLNIVNTIKTYCRVVNETNAIIGQHLVIFHIYNTINTCCIVVNETNAIIGQCWVKYS